LTDTQQYQNREGTPLMSHSQKLLKH